MEYALVHRDQRLLNALIQAGVKAAKQPDKALPTLEKKHYLPYMLKHSGAVLREVDQYGVDFRNVFAQTPLMVASRMGNAELIEALLDRDADTGLVDANGLNAFQIALERACTDERFARKRLPAVYERLAPPSLDIQVDGRLVKLDQRLMEYLMLCLSMVLFYLALGENYATRRQLMSAADIEHILTHFPESIVPARRKKRQYISSILAKNEIDRDDPYNRKLFLRWRRGEYTINPRLALRVEGEWRRIYDVLSPERLGAQLRDPLHWGEHRTRSRCTSTGRHGRARATRDRANRPKASLNPCSTRVAPQRCGHERQGQGHSDFGALVGQAEHGIGQPPAEGWIIRELLEQLRVVFE
jgi:hypothetical protein